MNNLVYCPTQSNQPFMINYMKMTGIPYCMADISDGVRQYTTNTPERFEILELGTRKIFNYEIIFNHGKQISDHQGGDVWFESAI